LWAFFGDVRSCTLKSHDSFRKCYERYVAAKQLVAPGGFRELADALSNRVIVYRDKMIVHETDPDRFLAIRGGSQPLIVSQKIDGTMETSRSTEALRPLPWDIERCVLLFLEILKTNENRTILAINPDLANLAKAKRLVDLVNKVVLANVVSVKRRIGNEYTRRGDFCRPFRGIECRAGCRASQK
jgi:hypothetical protein